MKDLEYYKNNAEENYITTPISVLRYISELEETLQIQDSGLLQVGYWFLDEYNRKVTVLHILNDWCVVEDDSNVEPYILSLEFILAIKEESDKFLSNDC